MHMINKVKYVNIPDLWAVLYNLKVYFLTKYLKCDRNDFNFSKLALNINDLRNFGENKLI